MNYIVAGYSISVLSRNQVQTVYCEPATGKLHGSLPSGLRILIRSKVSSQLYLWLSVGNNFKVNSRITINIILKSAVKDSSPVLGQLLLWDPWKKCSLWYAVLNRSSLHGIMVSSFDSLKIPPFFSCPEFSIIANRALSSLKCHHEINAVKNQYNCNLMPYKLARSECAVELTGRSIPQVVQVAQYVCASWHLSSNMRLFCWLRSVFFHAPHNDVNQN